MIPLEGAGSVTVHADQRAQAGVGQTPAWRLHYQNAGYRRPAPGRFRAGTEKMASDMDLCRFQGAQDPAPEPLGTINRALAPPEIFAGGGKHMLSMSEISPSYRQEEAHPGDTPSEASSNPVLAVRAPGTRVVLQELAARVRTHPGEPSGRQGAHHGYQRERPWITQPHLLPWTRKGPQKTSFA